MIFCLQGDPINCQTSSGVESKVLDDYCWIHSTFHVRSEYQGLVGCLVDPELVVERQTRQGQYTEPGYFLHHNNNLATKGTPDTSFYQWVPFILVFQVLSIFCPTFIYMCYLQFISHGIPT